MKRHFKSLMILAIAAILLAGCGTETSTPLVTSPLTKASPKPLPNKENPSRRQDNKRIPGTGPLVPASTEVAANVPATQAKPAEKPKSEDSAITRPKADREPTKPGDPEKITFDDLILGMQADMVFRPFMLTDRAKELEGKRVRLSGDMLPGVSKKVKEFIILRNNKCLYGKGGQADHVALVLMKGGHSIEYTSKTVRIEGKLKIEPVNGDDGNTKHLYVLEDAVAK
jgi:predicted small lipoprotein YifL